MNTRWLIRLVVPAWAVAGCGAAWANPSHKDVDAGLAVHGKTFSVELQARAQSLYEEVASVLPGFAERAQAGQVGRLDPKKLGRTYVMLSRLGRARAGRLS